MFHFSRNKLSAITIITILTCLCIIFVSCGNNPYPYTIIAEGVLTKFDIQEDRDFWTGTKRGYSIIIDNKEFKGDTKVAVNGPIEIGAYYYLYRQEGLSFLYLLLSKERPKAK